MLERICQITNFIFTQGETRQLVKLFRVLVLNSSAMARVSAFGIKNIDLTHRSFQNALNSSTVRPAPLSLAMITSNPLSPGPQKALQ